MATAGARILSRQRQGPSVALVIDPSDDVAMSVPAQMAVEALRQRLISSGATVRLAESLERAGGNDKSIIVSGVRSLFASRQFPNMNIVPPTAPESLMLYGPTDGRPVVACGADARGLSYLLLELADRLRAGAPLDRALAAPRTAEGRPDNPVRSVMRQFVSEPLDKPWFYDRAAWTRYLTMLATHRFNRLHLAFGLGYDTLQRVTDSYLLFAYPFLVDVPGYSVRVTNLDAAEREQNLDMLRFISEETVAHGLDFQLGLWMHGYQLSNSPEARYVVEGLTAETHAAYCRDALTLLLRELPAISSVGLRIHGESGIAEGSYEFWGTVFDGAARAGRSIEIDLHAKGIDATMIARAQATGMPVNVSPKFAAEHLGLPYHQAAIRELEMPVAGRTGQGLMTLSEGARSFTRYGYADLLREDGTYTVRTRVFSGTQRILAWGDPDFARAFSEAAGFCGMTGADLMEPLTCRGRRGTGVGRRDGYKEATPWRDDWEKYSAWYRSFGRMMYSRATPAEVFARDVSHGPLRAALAKASRILPLVTQAHLPSAACDAYWPEVYWNQPIVEPAERNPYFDTPAPATFQNVSPLDPEMFSTIAECVAELLGGERTGRYSPLTVAAWLGRLVCRVTDETQGMLPRLKTDALLLFDTHVQEFVGRFFAEKLRAGVLFALHTRRDSRRALELALAAYHRARTAWHTAALSANNMYLADLSASDRFDERGSWYDRLVGIDADIEAMQQRLNAFAVQGPESPDVTQAIADVLDPPRPWTPECHHVPPPSLVSGQGVDLELRGGGGTVQRVLVHYRHVNQAERYESVAMGRRGGVWRATIPAAYADSQFPLQYYFQLKSQAAAALYPGFARDLLNQPYFVLRRRS